MKMYLLTSDGISNNYYSGSQSHLFQRLIQENSIALLGFMLIAIILVGALYHEQLVKLSYTLISLIIDRLSG